MNLTIMKSLSLPWKMNANCGSDAYVATGADMFSRDVGVALTNGVDNFYAKNRSLIMKNPKNNSLFCWIKHG